MIQKALLIISLGLFLPINGAKEIKKDSSSKPKVIEKKEDEKEYMFDFQHRSIDILERISENIKKNSETGQKNSEDIKKLIEVITEGFKQTNIMQQKLSKDNDYLKKEMKKMKKSVRKNSETLDTLKSEIFMDNEQESIRLTQPNNLKKPSKKVNVGTGVVLGGAAVGGTGVLTSAMVGTSIGVVGGPIGMVIGGATGAVIGGTLGGGIGYEYYKKKKLKFKKKHLSLKQEINIEQDCSAVEDNKNNKRSANV